MTWATDALGLPADADSRAIKRAYAARLKTTRPDDDPAAFQQLHDTYQAALAWAADIVLPIDDAARADRLEAPSAALELPADSASSRRTRPALVECIQDPALEAELARWQDQTHVQACAAQILTAAHDMSGSDFDSWLSALPEVWSLDMRPRIGDAIVHQLANHHAHITDAVFDRLIATFGDDAEAELSHALWAARVLEMVLQQSPEFLSHWMPSRVDSWSPYQRAMIGIHLLRALGVRRPALRLSTIDTLMHAFDWHRWEGQDDLTWLRAARTAARQLEISLRRQAALAPGGDAAVLAYELGVAGWDAMTPQWAAALRSRLARRPSPWRSMATALLPARPAWMYRLCSIVQHWFPQQLPDSVHPENLRFWMQIGNPHRPHVRHLALGLARGLAMAALLSIGACMSAILSAIRPDSGNAAWAFPAIGQGLALWSALLLIQMAARWQARDLPRRQIRRVSHYWMIPIVVVAICASPPSGWMAALSLAVAYVAAYRLIGRLQPVSRPVLIATLALLGPLPMIVAILAGAGVWPGVGIALSLWLVSLIQDAQGHHPDGSH
ncbi:J domain-containing protein [Xanthomonas sp. 3058]|uniref:J domain-containing protein n=1 Tax=Xanthomonas sp. 3058 TaxID=3035314 RepID=UPI001613559D|nr:J domain-containing protein [Xanthomonas sp. 3058]MBB5863614.1 hypothetical protein [Xanthomonas sp. 3058]